MMKNLLVLITLCLSFSSVLADRAWPHSLEVNKITFGTAEYDSAKRCVSFTDQDDVVYYYDHNDDVIRLDNAQSIVSILMFAKASSSLVSMTTDDAPTGACGTKMIRNITIE